MVDKDPLVSIIGDGVRVSVLRACVLNPDMIYTEKDFVKSLRRHLPGVRASLKKMERDGLLIKKKISERDRKKRAIKEKTGYALNRRYRHLAFLREVIESSLPNEKDMLVRKIARVPGVKFVLTADIHKDKGGRGVDIVVASANGNFVVVEQVIRNAEKEMGRELLCSLMSVNDLAFRIQTNDRFLSDILSSEHTVHIDRMGLLSDA